MIKRKTNKTLLYMRQLNETNLQANGAIDQEVANEQICILAYTDWLLGNKIAKVGDI